MINSVVKVFLDTDMRLQHKGLREIASSKKINLSNLDIGEHVIFINTKLNRIKMWSRGNIISYLYKEKGRIDLQYIGEIPKAFDAHGKVDFDKAVRINLEKRLAKFKWHG